MFHRPASLGVFLLERSDELKLNGFARGMSDSVMKLILSLVALLMVGCADPAFQQYIAQRQAAVNAMPPGGMKEYAQERLDQQVLEEKRLEQQRAQAALAAGLAGAAAGAQAAAAYNYRPQPVVILY